MAELALSQIKPNRKRNFDVYPVKDEVVEGLMESYRRSGDFGLIPVRPLENGRYEQACGHHRLEAMKRLGFLKVAVKIAHFSDEEMTRIMIDENATQYGANPAACADSVLAIATDVAFAVFLSDDLENLGEISPRLAGAIGSNKVLGMVKTRLQKGDISGDVICVALGGRWSTTDKGHAAKGDSPLSPDAINSALQGLRADDHLANKIFAEQKRAHVELAARRAAEIRREKAAEEKREALRIEEEKARRLEIARLEAEHQKKIEAARKKKLEAAERKKQEAQRKREAQRIEKLRKEAEAAEAEVKADKEKRAAEARKKEKERLEAIAKENELREAARQRAEEEKYLAGGTQAMFENNAQFEAFRTVIKKNAQYFPIPEQHSLIKDMLSVLDKSEDGGDMRHKVTAAAIKKYLNNQVAERNKELKALLEKEEAEKIARKEALAVYNKAKRIHDGLDGLFRQLAAGLAEFDLNIDDREFQEAWLQIPHSQYLYGNMNMLEKMLPRLRETLGVAARSITETTTVENVIN